MSPPLGGGRESFVMPLNPLPVRFPWRVRGWRGQSLSIQLSPPKLGVPGSTPSRHPLPVSPKPRAPAPFHTPTGSWGGCPSPPQPRLVSTFPQPRGERPDLCSSSALRFICFAISQEIRLDRGSPGSSLGSALVMAPEPRHQRGGSENMAPSRQSWDPGGSRGRRSGAGGGSDPSHAAFLAGRNFARGSCRWGQSCRFSHDRKSVHICKYFQRGFCSYGEQCR